MPGPRLERKRSLDDDLRVRRKGDLQQRGLRLSQTGPEPSPPPPPKRFSLTTNPCVAQRFSARYALQLNKLSS